MEGVTDDFDKQLLNTFTSGLLGHPTCPEAEPQNLDIYSPIYPGSLCAEANLTYGRPALAVRLLSACCRPHILS